MSEGIVNLTDDGFEAEVLKAELPTLVDFWAPWCGPCRALTPVIEAAATDYAGKAQVCKMNIDENPKTPSNYEVKAIPTILIFKGGEVVEQMVGLVSKAKIDEALAKHTN
jgi:thioredoxin 1